MSRKKRRALRLLFQSVQTKIRRPPNLELERKLMLRGSGAIIAQKVGYNSAKRRALEALACLRRVMRARATCLPYDALSL
jgi:hypothetical protein